MKLWPFIFVLLAGCSSTPIATDVSRPAAAPLQLASPAVVIWPDVPPNPVIVPPPSNGWWHVQWNPGSENTRTNYVWFIRSTTNLAIPPQDEPQQWDGTDLIFRPQPNYFFGLHGITNS